MALELRYCLLVSQGHQVGHCEDMMRDKMGLLSDPAGSSYILLSARDSLAGMPAPQGLDYMALGVPSSLRFL